MRTKSGDKSPDSQKMHVATVLCVGEVRLVTAATSRHALERNLADHVRKNARHQLLPQAADKVYRLLDNNRFDRAIEIYFASVGERWDEERLVINEVMI